MIVIVDYGSGNTGSILNMLKRLGVKSKISSRMDDLESAQGLVLPGIGAFDSVMGKLTESGLIPTLERRVLQEKLPLIGICVGMQMLFKGSDEGVMSGLGWIEGSVQRFEFDSFEQKLKIPHMGWNIVDFDINEPLFSNFDNKTRFYFAHSFHAVCDEQYAISSTAYGYRFSCGVRRGNVYGVQFHPEKSHRFGMQLFRNFAEIAC